MTTLTKSTNITSRKRTEYDFGVVQPTKTYGDRTVGASITTLELDVVPVAAGRFCGMTMAPGHYFVLYVSATRNGEDFGGGKGGQYFASADKREVAIQKYLKSAQYRATKKFA